MGAENQIWLYINKHYTEEEETTGYLLEFIINDLRWELNYKGDAPLMIYRSNGDKHILQIDGDLFFPTVVDFAALENDEEVYDGYLFPIEEALKLLNMLLYADLELEINTDDYDEAEQETYSLYYDGEQQGAFNHFLQKVKEEKEITEDDINSLK